MSLSTHKPSISLIVPLYNDENTVTVVVSKALRVLPEISSDFEIILIDDGSPDNVGAIADELAMEHSSVRVIHHEINKGYGAALHSGFEASRMEWVSSVDGDDEYDVMDLKRLAPLTAESDLIITFRHIKLYSSYRIFISYVYNNVLRLLFGTKFKDINTGLRMMRRSLFLDINPVVTSPFFGAELVIKSAIKKYKVKEVGINTYPRKFGSGSATSVKNIFATIIDMLKLFFQTTRWEIASFVAMSIIFFVAGVGMALNKPLWFDELATWHIAFSPSFAHIWKALLQGADVQPPLYFALTKAVSFIFGTNLFTLILPALVAFWGYVSLLYFYVSRITSKRVGVYAVLFALLNFSYAIQARPYSFVLLFGMGALVSWAYATRGISRNTTISLMCISLFLAFLSHYYACIIIIPLALGECIRFWRDRKIDTKMALGLGSSLVAYLLCLPIILSAQKYSEHFWEDPQSTIFSGYKYFLGEHYFNWVTGLVIVSIAIIFVFKKYLKRDIYKVDLQASTSFNLHEKVAVGVFCFSPVFVYLLSLVTNASTSRYSIALCIGFPIVFAYIVGRISFQNKCLNRVVITGITMFLIFIPVIKSKTLFNYFTWQSEKNQRCVRAISELPEYPKAIAITNHFDFTMLYHYVSPAVRQRLWYPTDRDGELKYKKEDADYRTLTGLRGVYYLPVMDTKQFVQSNESFWMMGYPQWIGDVPGSDKQMKYISECGGY